MSRVPVSKGTSEAPDVEPGTYKATCIKVKDDFIENSMYGSGDVVRLYMQLTDVLGPEGEEVILDGIANRKITPLSKLTRWADALGRVIDFDSEDDFDTEELVGGECLIKVERKDKDSWPKVTDLTALPKIMARSVDPPGSIGEFWAKTRQANIPLAVVKQSAEEMFGKAPANLTEDERDELLKALEVPF